MARVLLAMSGGVDSSVAAALLQQQGHEVVGCFMRLGSPGEELDQLRPAEACAMPGAGAGGAGTTLRIGHQGCCSINDAADARLVAARLDVPFYVVNFKKDFGRIVDYFVAEYNAGRTPNPCVRCNDWLKFGRLHEYARQIEADFVASGHYAQVVPDGTGGHALLRGVDHGKDQSYVLFGARRESLARMLLPIGGLRKAQVRELARGLALPVFDKPDSQEICFVPDDDYAALVARRAPESVRPGPIVDLEGRVVGEHPGHQHFTVGQRRGVRVAMGLPIFVVRKEAQSNTVVVGPREALLRAGCIARECNWLDAPTQEWRGCMAKIRYNAPPVPAQVRALAAQDDGQPRLEVRFEQLQEAVAPGQAVVCYAGERVVCGGWIDAATEA
ncbi:MAG: tRNA 2-thiouridine(34) synthase MnmA [Phycisphaerales bacterium]